jgi:cell division protein FtsN
MAKPAPRNRGRSGGSPIFTGVMIGLIVGAVLAVGVALWATGVNPFKSATPAPAKPEPTPAKPVPAAPAKPDAAPSFDFYKVLPSDHPSELPPAAAPRAPAPRYYLQAGAFRSAAEADNVKAQLALLGVEAAIQTSDVPGKGVFHRVRVGPYRAMNEVEHTRSLLTQNNIPTTLVKEVPNNQETP